MQNQTRVRINLKEREIEFEGSEAFLEKYQSTIAEFIEKIREDKVQESSAKPQNDKMNSNEREKESKISPNGEPKMVVPESFGEFYSQFPRNAKVVDKMLISAYFVQVNSEDGLFTPSKAAELLNEQNVLITNASAFIKSLQNTGKLYKQAGKFKVHEKGIEYIRQLMGLAA